MNRLLRSWIVVTVCITTLYVLPVQAQVLTMTRFGRATASGADPSAGAGNYQLRASRYTLTEPGTARELCAYLDGNGGATDIGSQFVRFMLFRRV